jgi:hypothetical protein
MPRAEEALKLQLRQPESSEDQRSVSGVAGLAWNSGYLV